LGIGDANEVHYFIQGKRWVF